LVSISDEVDLWLLLSGCWWSSNGNLVVVASLLEENVDEVLLFVLFWKDNFSLGRRVLGWSLHEDDVNVLVSSWNSDDFVLSGGWLIWSRVDVDLKMKRAQLLDISRSALN